MSHFGFAQKRADPIINLFVFRQSLGRGGWLVLVIAGHISSMSVCKSRAGNRLLISPIERIGSNSAGQCEGMPVAGITSLLQTSARRSPQPRQPDSMKHWLFCILVEACLLSSEMLWRAFHFDSP